MKVAVQKLIGLAVAGFASAAVQAAELPTFHMTCEGILASKNGFYSLDDARGPSRDDDDVCRSATVERGRNISRVLKTCSVGGPCRIEGVVKNLTHGVFIFVRVDSASSQITRR
jgi:hypothetical protein